MLFMIRSVFFMIFGGLTLVACEQQPAPGLPTVSELANPGGSGSRYPFIVSGKANDSVLMSWLEGDSEWMNLMWSSWNGSDWTTPELIRRSDRFFVNWADFPSISVVHEKPMAAHWLQKVEGSTYAYHVNLALRSDSGKWTEPITPHEDRSPSEHGFVSMLPLDKDRVFAVWLDGYQTEQGNPMTLHSAIINPDGSIEQESEVDGSVCDCCQTSIARSGDSIIAVYRNRTEGEVRDIYRAVYDLNSGTWGSPVVVSDDKWEIAGCPVNGPQVAAQGETVIVSWFTAAGHQPRSYMAVSQDGGTSFSKARRLDTGETAGRVGVTFNRHGTALLTWVGIGVESNIVQGRFWRDSRLGKAFEIGHIDLSRASGFPRSAAFGQGFLLAWTEADNESISGIRSILLAPSSP